MNKVILMGRLTRDPDVRYTQRERTDYEKNAGNKRGSQAVRGMAEK